MMRYKGYSAEVRFDSEDSAYSGVVNNVRDTIHFEGATLAEARAAFRDSVDAYLAACREFGKDPEHPFSGRMSVSIAPDLHRAAVLAAQAKGETLSAFVSETLQRAIKAKAAARA